LKEIVLASSNPGKVREINQLLATLDLHVQPQSKFGVIDAEETGLTFVENAILKARNAAQHTGLPAIADDSGLEVTALGGAPGVHSARYAGVAADDAANNSKLLDALAGLPPTERGARFRCVMVFVRGPDDPSPVVADCSWDGFIASEARGAGGFGYDPLFIDPASGRHSAELPPEEKNARSHRGQAARALRDQLLEQPGSR